MNKYYAGIGSRETPENVCERMTKLAGILERKGYILRSGGAVGADRAFEDGVKPRGAEIFYPHEESPLWTQLVTSSLHPNPEALTENGWKLMNRNAMQILGRDGNTPVEFVVAWTKNGRMVGGTAQAMRIAKFFDIPIYNFYNEQQIEKLKQYLKGV